MRNSRRVSNQPELKTSRVPIATPANFLPTLIYFSVFSTAVIAAMVQNFCVPNTRTALLYDAHGYLLTTKWVENFLYSLLHLHPDFSLVIAPEHYHQILMDCPIFPLINALIFLPFHHVPTAFEWKWLIVVQTFWLGASSCLCSYIAAKITKSRLCSCAAGLLWAFYPAALISTERYLTELLAATMLLGSICLMCSQNVGTIKGVTAGLLAGLLTLTKAALLPVSLALAVATTIFVTRKRIFVIAFLLGVICILAPWAFYTKMVGGTMYFTPQRYTAYNFAVGFDLESNGWCTTPHTPFQALFENSDAPFTTTLAQWQQHPVECAVLVVKKLSRLYAQPWNDFRHKVFGLGLETQCAYHTAIFTLGIFAIIYFCAVRRLHATADEKLTMLLCTVAFTGHLVYIIFQSINRYAFTGIPYVCILAVYGIWAAFQEAQLEEQKIWKKKIAGTVVASVILVYGIQNAEAFTQFNSTKEIPRCLQAGNHIISRLDLCNAALPHTFDAYVLVDGDSRVRDSHIVFNGHAVTAPLMPDYYFDSSQYAQSYLLKEYSAAEGMSSDCLRNWRMAKILPSWVRHRVNSIDLSPGPRGCTTYSDPKPTRNLPYLNTSVPDNLANNYTHNDPRMAMPYLVATVNHSAFLLVNRTPGELGDKFSLKTEVPRLRLLVAFPGTRPAYQARSATEAKVLLDRDISLCEFDPVLTMNSPNALRINRAGIRLSRTTGTTIALPPTSEDDHLHVQLTGLVRKNVTNGTFGVKVAFGGNHESEVVITSNPHSLSASSKWSSFCVDDIVPVRSITRGKRYVCISFYPGPWLDIATHGWDSNSSDVSIRDLHLRLSTCDFPDIAGKRVIIY